MLTADREEDAQDFGGDVLGGSGLPDSEAHEVVAAKSAAHASPPVLSGFHNRGLDGNLGSVHARASRNNQVGVIQ